MKIKPISQSDRRILIKGKIEFFFSAYTSIFFSCLFYSFLMSFKFHWISIVVGNILTIELGIIITHRFYRQSKFIYPILIKANGLFAKNDKETRQLDIISIIGFYSTLIFGLLITLFTLFLEKNILGSLYYFVCSIIGSIFFGLLLEVLVIFPLMILDFIFLIDHKTKYFFKKTHKLPAD